MKKKTIIGIIGSPGSGKETVSKLIAEQCGRNVHHVAFSGPLMAFLLDMGYSEEKRDRPTLQLLGQNLDKHFGKGTVTRGALQLIQDSTASVDIVDGVRWETDFEALRSLANNSTKCVMVYVWCDSKTRFDRLKQRRQRAGEEKMTKSEFLKQDDAPNEQLIPTLGNKADIRIDNTGTLKDLQNKVNDLCAQHLR